MSPEPEDFEKLRKLLALKRHETPPPGYFDHLPRRIETRLRANEWTPTFLESIFECLHRNISMAYAFALTACGALAMGIIYTAHTESARADAQPRDLAVSWSSPENAGLAAEAAPTPFAGQELHVATWTGGTNPVSQGYHLPSLFAHPLQPATLPAAYEAAAP